MSMMVKRGTVFATFLLACIAAMEKWGCTRRPRFTSYRWLIVREAECRKADDDAGGFR